MPSKGEGFGIVFLEALSCGKPVLAGNKDGSVDALLNGKLGTLVDPDDPAEIAEALIRILSRRAKSIATASDPSTAGSPGGEERSTLNAQRPTSNEDVQAESERLRREVIAAYGYERFRDRDWGRLSEKVESGK